MNCSDSLTLQRLLDGDLDETQSEIVAHHLESCSACRAEMKKLAEVRSFAQDQLGTEDEGEEETTAAVLARVSGRLPAQPTRRNRFRWNRASIAAAVIFLALLMPLPFVSTLDAWPTRILNEAALRERTWLCQPNKVLHWEVDSLSMGIKGVADGRWRTLFWRKNGDTTFLEISRQFKPDGRTRYAYWHQPDGSSVRYESEKGLLEITPPTAVAREALPTLPPELRAALHSHLTDRALNRNLDVHSRRDAESFHGGAIWTSGDARFRTSVLDALGAVHQITVVKEGSDSNPGIIRAVHEYDVETSTLRLRRLKTTITYADGTAGIHDSRWVTFRETSESEFNAQTPRDLMDGGTRVVRLTPREIAERRLQETSTGTKGFGGTSTK